jgi:hypothetical protein
MFSGKPKNYRSLPLLIQFFSLPFYNNSAFIYIYAGNGASENKTTAVPLKTLGGSRRFGRSFRKGSEQGRGYLS